MYLLRILVSNVILKYNNLGFQLTFFLSVNLLMCYVEICSKLLNVVDLITRVSATICIVIHIFMHCLFYLLKYIYIYIIIIF